MAERAIGNIVDGLVGDWRQAASETVLVAVLRGRNPHQHLEWIRETRQYYLPIRLSQPRFHELTWLSIYLPAAIRRPGAVELWAPVEGIEVKERRLIDTPWPAGHDSRDSMFVYRLGPLAELANPVVNAADDGHGQAIRQHRWTTRLGLLRATNLNELLLETEPEWRLYEALRAAGIAFKVEAGPAASPDPRDPRGRARFAGDGWRVQYGGAEGFRVLTLGGEARLQTKISEIVASLR